jgi:DNA-binding LytR/AlgR family response regulator
MNASALIAEDEPLLAQALQAGLQQAWPELSVAGVVGDGASAVRAALAQQPDVLFLDIRMPGQSGLEAAEALADEWPADAQFPLLVFVTAYDQYAIAAFERAAVDYLLKPVEPERLARTCARLRAMLALRANGTATASPVPGTRAPVAAAPRTAEPGDDALESLRRLLAAHAAPAQPRLRVIPAGVGQTVRMIPVGEVLAFEAADKYVLVVTAAGETPIRVPLKELQPQLDPDEFWQIHRGTVVRASAIESATRDEAGRTWVRLRGLERALAVSRLWAQRFRPL